MRKSWMLCATAAVLALTPLSAVTADQVVVDSNGKVVGPTDGFYVIVKVLGQYISVPFNKDGVATSYPFYYYSGKDCSGDKFIQSNGIVAAASQYNGNIYFGGPDTSAKLTVLQSTSFYDGSAGKFRCQTNSVGTFTNYVAPVRKGSVSLLGNLKPPFSFKIQ